MALREVERYFDNPPTPETDEADRFDVLSTLIEKYEDSQYLIPEADPIDVLNFVIESMGRSQADLGRIIGRACGNFPLKHWHQTTRSHQSMPERRGARRHQGGHPRGGYPLHEVRN